MRSERNQTQIDNPDNPELADTRPIKEGDRVEFKGFRIPDQWSKLEAGTSRRH